MRPVLTGRASMETYERVAAAARRANRKLGEEAIYRVEQSFIWEENQMRFKPETHAIVKGAADLARHSLAEEVEYRIEKMLAESALKAAMRFDAKLGALTKEEFAQIIEDAVKRALARVDNS